MLRRVFGVILLVWGIVMIPMLYQSIKNGGEEVTGTAIGVSIGVCIAFVGLGIWLIRSGKSKVDSRPRMFKVYRNRRY